MISVFTMSSMSRRWCLLSTFGQQWSATRSKSVKWYSASSSSTVGVQRNERRRRELPPPLKITEAAADRIRDLMAKKPEAVGIRLGVRTRGCNGLSYTMNYADRKAPMEEEVKDKGVCVFVEPKALFHVVGTTMDFHTSPLGSEFVFENPNAKGSCGCGESFNV